MVIYVLKLKKLNSMNPGNLYTSFPIINQHRVFKSQVLGRDSRIGRGWQSLKQISEKFLTRDVNDLEILLVSKTT